MFKVYVNDRLVPNGSFKTKEEAENHISRLVKHAAGMGNSMALEDLETAEIRKE